MKPTILFGPLGDDPPKAELYYGLHVIDALRLLPDNSVNTCCTSPPYWALRDYKVEPQVWGGDDPECSHDWGIGIVGRGQSGGTGKSTLGSASGGHYISPEGIQRSLERSQTKEQASAFCLKCGAWRGCLGLEPTPGLFRGSSGSRRQRDSTGTSSDRDLLAQSGGQLFWRWEHHEILTRHRQF